MRQAGPGTATIFSMIVLVLIGLNFGSGPTEGTAVLSGTVKDETGSGLNGVLVHLINIDRHVSVSVITQAGGRYSADSLFPGSYEVRAERKGYQTAAREGL